MTQIVRSPLASATFVAILVAALLAGCGDSDETGTAKGDKRLQVATSVAPITNIVAEIAGDAAEVTGLIPEGADSHIFEPDPSVAERLSRVDVVYLNGLQLEEPLRKLSKNNLGDGAEIVALGDRVLPNDERIYDHSFPKSEGKPNPHLWTSPPYLTAYAQVIADDLSERDPDNENTYRANLKSFEEDIKGLDKAMRADFETIPMTKRKLLTYHDAYAYFARDYEFEIIGAIQPASFSEPTPKQVEALIDQVRRLGVPAIFGSEVFPSPVLEQIGREAGVRYVDELRDDDLPGDPGDPEHSLIGLLRFNYLTITQALGGTASSLQDIELRTIDKASYS